MSDIKERLKKIRELALRDVPGGEKEAAQKLLDKLMKKYDISLSEIENEKVTKHIFTYHGKEQLQLIIQVAYKVTGNSEPCIPMQYTHSGRLCRTKVGVYCTSAQAVEIGYLYDFYVALWEREKDVFLDAYIQKHRIFGVPQDDVQPTEVSDDERKKLRAFMSGLSDDTPRKLLEG